MSESNSGIGNVTPNAELVQMAMSHSRSCTLCAAARLGVADALGDEVRSVDRLAETAACSGQHRHCRGNSAETFSADSVWKAAAEGVAQSARPAIVFWADLLADNWSLLTNCVRMGKPASQVRDPNVPSRWSQE